MKLVRQLPILIGVLIFISACAVQTGARPQPPVFEHDITGTAVPWTHTSFDDEAGKFTFALFSDLTGGERDGVFEVAVEQLQLLRPELIICVGDLIEGGGTDHEQLAHEWDSFDERAERSRAPIFYVGGNHDLTNPDMWEVWEERYGKRYYHFIYKDVLFLVLDTEDNSTEFQQYTNEIRLEALKLVESEGWAVLPKTKYGQLEERNTGRIGKDQAAYFRNVIAKHPQVRWTYVLMHKAAWLRPDEENFSTIEAALSGHPYTVFHGHEHSYLHEQRHGMDYIRLGTTGGVHISGKAMSIDHVTLVTVSEDGSDITNLRMSGIFDKTGEIPLQGDEYCLEDCFGQ